MGFFYIELSPSILGKRAREMKVIIFISGVTFFVHLSEIVLQP